MSYYPIKAVLRFSHRVVRRRQVENLVAMDALKVTIEALLEAVQQMVHVKTCHNMVSVMGLAQVLAQEVRCTDLSTQEAWTSQECT